MYADETRRLALRLMMDEGMTARGAVAELRRRGLRAPSERTARTWRAECLRGKSEHERQGFDVRVRREVVDVYLRTGDAAMAASMAGCRPATVYTWRTKLYGGRKERAMAADAGRRAGDGDGVEELRARCERLEFENRLLKVQNDILKGVGPRDLTNMEKTRAVLRMHERHGYPLARLFAAVGLARATYHRLVRRLGEPSRVDLATPLVHEAFERLGRVAGYRRVHRVVNTRMRVGERTVRMVMKRDGLVPLSMGKAPRAYSSYTGELSGAPANLVGRRFHAERPNMLWVTDVTQFTMDGYKCWLSVLTDCFDGTIVSWTMSRRPDAHMANSMLRKAVATLRDGQRPVVHSDRGCHYRWPGWIEICERHGLVRSMSAKGCSPDNAAEGVFGCLKNEAFHGRDWTGVPYGRFKRHISAWISYHNKKREKQTLGWKSPVQYRKSLGLTS